MSKAKGTVAFLLGLAACRASGVKKPIPEVIGANVDNLLSTVGAIKSLELLGTSVRNAKTSSIGTIEPLTGKFSSID